MLSEEIISRLITAGEKIDPSNPVYWEANAVSSKPRVLDKAPPYIKLRKLDDGQRYGACYEFISSYSDYKKSMNLEMACIRVGELERLCDPDIFYALHCLGKACIHCDLERATAAADLFKLLMTTPGEVLTVKIVYDRLKQVKSKDYYTKQFLQALQLCLFGGNSVNLYWLSIASDHGVYKNASKLGASMIAEKGWNETDVKKELNTAYAQAKEDKEFMKSLYRPACNKYMAAMIYLLKDKHPEALDTTGSRDGFL